jgi:uncharacterized protein
MIVDLTAIEGAEQEFDFTISPDQVDIEETNVRLTGDLRACGTVVKRSAQVDVSGLIEGPAEVDCTRCLKPIEQNLAIEFAVSFVTPDDFAADKEREVAAEDLATDVLDSESLNIKDVVREQILLELPEQVFCKPDCKGLCPQCGADRNLIDCKCDEREIDPRWAALKDFRS